MLKYYALKVYIKGNISYFYYRDRIAIQYAKWMNL